MQIDSKEVSASGVKLFLIEQDKEIARVYLYLLRNDLHNESFGFLEDLFVAETHRRQGLATVLIKEAIKLAKERGCYKLISTSRFGREPVHKLYEEFGFKKWGFEFRIDL